MTYDDCRYELPDYILGKSSPEAAAEIERLIETNPAFRAEFLEMKALIEQTKPMLDRAFESPPQAYFESLSKRVLAQTRAKKRSLWQTLQDDFKALFIARWQEWSGALAGASLAMLLIIGAGRLDEARQASMSVDLPNAIATSAFALGVSPESLASQFDDEALETTLRALERDLPAQPRYEILTESDLDALFKPL